MAQVTYTGVSNPESRAFRDGFARWVEGEWIFMAWTFFLLGIGWMDGWVSVAP